MKTIKLLYAEGHKIDEWEIKATERQNGTMAYHLIAKEGGGILQGFSHYNSQEQLIDVLKARFNSRVTFDGSTPFTTYFLVKSDCGYFIKTGHSSNEESVMSSKLFSKIKKEYDRLS